ncbi:exonuclease RecJ [Dokdonia sp. Hel_I_63]|uniref:single-stranded-DNA-specific exonuclease RecJ n=1 Tax=unclassified Dokdonia TaxID=2615033 RepID=UPI00020A6D71|nr:MULTISPECIES: single-stranded-DNA-specific exonuclease RecJ [unclassified Dokdonia]AEE19063.1 single-stranded-DNA-specific exonuclease RecJ [Dokdonia sp. 4H-3-7-5]TVZ21704.1 exonuclease RecJ [Dokdonia sp. Hel_I_63]
MRWTLKPKPEAQKVTNLAKELGVEEPISRLLIQRDIDTFEKAKQFFRPSLDDLYDPFLMKDMDVAVARIEQAIAQGENILVFGDYDVDGTTSVALMSSYLDTIHPQVATYIPDRYAEGYGVSYMGIDFAADNDMTLIIALDCGVKAIEKVAYAKEKGIDFIICDHHRPGDQLPDAVAILDPKREDCSYPYDELCGCGVGFKLISAIALSRKQNFEELLPYLDLVATAIGADIVPITGENRILAYHGLNVINHAPRAGFEAIIKQVKKQTLTITDVVFIIGPRINAAGRMVHGNHAVTLLRETNLDAAIKFASEIEQYNSDRKEADKSITQQALDQIIESKEEGNKTTVVFQEDWHKGVIGIVASRLIETYYRPTLVFTRSGDKYAASARSVKGFDVYNALHECAEHIEQFGGHKYAAGLTLAPEQYEAFKEKFEQVVAASCDERLLVPEIAIDSEIDLADITPKFHRILKQFAPFGPQNMSPTFMTQNLIDTGYGKKVGADQTHLKATVIQNNRGQRIGCIGFNLGDKYELIEDKKIFKAAYSLDENEWNGNVSLQLRLKDIQ